MTLKPGDKVRFKRDRVAASDELEQTWTRDLKDGEEYTIRSYSFDYLRLKDYPYLLDSNSFELIVLTDEEVEVMDE